MKTLDQHNTQAHQSTQSEYPKLANVLCPKCNAEMVYPFHHTLTGKTKFDEISLYVECPKCKYVGYKLMKAE